MELQAITGLLQFGLGWWNAKLADEKLAQAAARDGSALRRLLCLELRQNADLIGTISDDVGQWSPACVAVARRLDITYLSVFLLPGEASAGLDALVADVALNLVDDDVLTLDDVKTVGGVLPSLYVRAGSVINLATMETKPDGLRDVKLAIRLRNLRRDFDAVRRAIEMAQVEGTRKLAMTKNHSE